jgi:hypothetical protein
MICKRKRQDSTLRAQALAFIVSSASGSGCESIKRYECLIIKRKLERQAQA